MAAQCRASHSAHGHSVVARVGRASTWADRGKEGARPGPREPCRFVIKPRFLNQNNFKRSKAGFFLINFLM
jgi:hypothetical protein